MRALAVALAALALAGPAVAAPPRVGVLDPGRSLGGLRIGDTTARVRALWGGDHGTCRSCPTGTWYFTYRPFKPEGAAVELTRGRVSAIYTLWLKTPWRTRDGRVRIGTPAAALPARVGPLLREECGTYYALTTARGGRVSTFYIVGEKVFGFGLSREGAPVCH